MNYRKYATVKTKTIIARVIVAQTSESILYSYSSAVTSIENKLNTTISPTNAHTIFSSWLISPHFNVLVSNRPTFGPPTTTCAVISLGHSC